MRTIAFLFGFVMVVLIAAGCSGSSEKPGIDSSNWKLVTLNGVPFKLTDDKMVTMQLTSETSKVSGKAPCNSYSGTYNEARGQLQFMNIISTKMACDDLSKESEYFAALNSVTNYNIAPGTLKLMTGGKVVAEFSKIK
jgi:heat shock protein HslJ